LTRYATKTGVLPTFTRRSKYSVKPPKFFKISCMAASQCSVLELRYAALVRPAASSLKRSRQAYSAEAAASAAKAGTGCELASGCTRRDESGSFAPPLSKSPRKRGSRTQQLKPAILLDSRFRGNFDNGTEAEEGKDHEKSSRTHSPCPGY
jgi:hypothetical protein